MSHSIFTCLIVGLFVLQTALAAETRPDSIDEMRPARQKALLKQRRVFFNDDTYELSRDDANTPEGYLKRRLKPLVGTQVDVISWSVLGGWADAPVYDSKVQPIYGDAHGGPPPYWTKVTKNVKALIAGGRCPLQITIDFAHDNQMELFASIRMNDCHDSFIPGGQTLWKKAHPEFLVDRGAVPKDKDAHPLGLYVTAQDFTHREVRDRKIEIIEEVCARYDIDGIDLNYPRHAVLFSSTMRGEAVSAEEVAIMTRMTRRIRKITDKHGARRGRPILVAAIVPDNLHESKRIGLDVKTWIEEDLIDIVVPGLGYAPFSVPVEEFTEIAGRHGVRVYPCINRKAPNRIEDAHISEGFRGAAANWYRAGADGVFYWNLATPIEYKDGAEMIAIRNRYYDALDEVGDPKTLRERDKLFCLTHWVLDYYEHITSDAELPVELKPQTVQRLDLSVADDVGAASKAGTLSNLRLDLRMNSPLAATDIRVTINGDEVTKKTVVPIEKNGDTVIECQPTATSFRQGKNALEITLLRRVQKQVDLKRLYLFVRYDGGASSQ